jgi:dihydrofolate reductase
VRKIIVIADVTLNGVVQAPGAVDEDTSGGFKYGGWIAPYVDKHMLEAARKFMEPASYLLGRKTFEIFANYWPRHADFWPGINQEIKYVFSKTMKTSDPIAIGWKNTVFIQSLEDVKRVKKSEGKDIQVWGSGKLVQLLLKNDLVDEIYLKIYPLTLSEGKKLFEDGTISAAFKLVESYVTATGVIIAKYKRDGNVNNATVTLEGRGDLTL